MQNCSTCTTDLQCLSFDSLFPQLFFHFLHVMSDQMTRKQTEEFVAQICMPVKMYAVERKKCCVLNYVMWRKSIMYLHFHPLCFANFLMIIFNYKHIP